MTAALVFALLLLAAPAAAAPVIAPPGHSEADQYFETVPGPLAPQSPDHERTVEDAVADGILAPKDAAVLEQSGEAGEGLARTVAQTSPPGSGDGGSGDGGSGGGGAGEAGAGTTGQAAGGAGGRDALPAPATSIAQQGGLGVLLPLILGALALFAAVYLYTQWRRSHPRRGAGPA